MNKLTQYLVDSILNEEVEEKVTVMLPGGFKPPHSGHLHLASTYAKHKDVEKVLILIGPKPRDGFTREQSIKIWNLLIKSTGLNNIEIVPVDAPNPMLSAYQYVETADPGVYAFGASSKGSDYERVKNFTEQHQEGGKYYDRLGDGVSVTLLPIDPSPMLYKNRTDGLKGGISASTLRKDVEEGNVKNIISNYPKVQDSILKQIVALLTNKPMAENKFRHDKTIILEGGAAGHMKHPYDDLDLSFGDLKDMIDVTLSGNLEYSQEKLDGQNLMVTFKDGELRGARNKSHLKNSGENSLTISQVDNMFNDRGAIQAAFVQAMKDLSAAIKKLSPEEKAEYFMDGKKFISLEVLYPDTTNVIPYGVTELRLHHFKEYDENGNVVEEDTDGIEKLQKSLDAVEAANQKTFKVKTTDLATVKQDEDYTNQAKSFEADANKLQKKYNLSDSDTIGTYLENWWSRFMEKVESQKGFTLDEETKESLVRRWARAEKQPNIRVIIKGESDEEAKKWIYNFDRSSDIKKAQKSAIRPIETLFLRLGVRVLQNIENLIAMNPDEAINAMKKELKKSIERIKKAAQNPELSKKQNPLEFLKAQLQRLQDIGGFDAIVPTEGLVFKYKGKLYKLTGSFAPINQILGYMRF